MRFIFLIIISLFFTVEVSAQLCTPQTVTFPITPTSTLQYTPSYSSGVILFPFTATAGCTYTFSTCGQSSIDTYLRLHNAAYTLLGQWDDQCGLQSTFTWTCPAAGQYYVHLSRFVCTALTAPTTMSYIVSCPTPPCSNPIVNAGPDVVICAGQPTNLNGTVSAGTGTGSGGSASSITVTISGSGFLDETSWNLTNASGTSVGSGGPYIFASNNTVTLTNVGTGPYSFSMETQGNFNDNNATYTISCNGTTVNTGSITGGQTTTASVTGCGGTSGGGTLPITYVWSPGATLSSTTILTPTATPTVTTTYTLTATSGTCTSTDEVTVFVSPAPTINAGPDVTICAGQTTSLNGSASAVGGFGGPIDVNIFSGSNLDETTWNITNSLGAIIASGGPYAAGSNQTITINAPSNPPFTFNLETQGPSNSNVAGYNVLCGGTSISGGLAILTGGQTIAVPVSGCPGSIPTTLSWSPGATLSSTTVANPTASPTTTTTYTLTATANGCTSTDNVVVNVVSGPSVTVNNATICGGQTATLTATPSAGGGTYLWSPGGATTQSINVSPTATTAYTVTYSNGSCSSAPATGTVTVSASPSLSVNSSTICPGASTTLIATASPSGGTYLWAPNGETTQTISVSPAATTTYSVSYNLNGCSSSTANGTVTVSNIVDWANIQSPGSTTICQGQTLTIYGQVFEAGVTPPAGQGAGITVQYAYNTSNTNPATWPSSSWTTATFNPGGTSLNNDEYSGIIPSLSPGTYYYAFSYTMNGCTNYGGYSLSGGGFWDGTTNVNGTLIVNPNVAPTFNPITAICAGGALNALPTTSLNSIAGSWSPALNNQTTTSYTFTPAVGVCATTAILTITVNPLPIAAITAPTTTVLTCATQSIALTATGGGTYSWSNGTTVVGSAATLNLTSPGTYTVTVTSANGCTATASQVITQNISLPVVAITPPTTTVLTCTTTSINLTATGGGTYSWSNGTTNLGSAASINVTTPGVYTVTVTGANGCTATANSNITQNIVAPITSIVSFANTTVLDCNINVITLAASGAGGWVSSSWSNGTTVITTNNNLSVSTPGTYTVTVTGANGCIGTATQVITQNIAQPNALITTPLTTVLTCSTPTISLTGTGGGTYSWMDGNGVIGTSATINITSANTYTLIVTGSNGCDATASITITDNFVAPIVSVTASNTVLSCTNTSITLVASGGGSYSWTGGSTSSSLTVTSPGTYTVTVTSPNGCTSTSNQVITQNIAVPTTTITSSNNGQLTCTVTSITLTATGGGSYLWGTGATTASISVTTPGTYPVTVTSTNGCTATASQVVTQNITAPTAAITTPSTTVLTCTASSIGLTATGGSTYSWSNGTTTIGNSATLSVTLPGTYTVTVTGSNGCTATVSQTITQNSVAPVAGINPLSNAVLTCTTPSITITATGGGTYSWSNGTSVVGTNATLNVTTPGTYTVTVTAANGCTATATQTITQNNAAPLVTITPPVSSVLTCTTTSISLTANGVGTISWSNPALISINPTILVTTPGVYTVTLTAANGCTANVSQTITQNITAPAAAITTPSTTILTCATTSITLTATGGGTYSWSNGTTVVGTSAALVVTTPGTYTVTVTGTNGCTTTATQSITQNTIPPTAGINTPTTTILTCTTTSIPLTATGGGTYSWYTGTTLVGNTSTLSVTNPGFYTVVVTAPNGCDALTNFVITQDIVAPVASITNNTNSTVLNCNTTQISLTGVGGTSASWSNGTSIVSGVANLNVTAAGTYTYTGTNANGCFDTESITITFTANTNPTFTQIAPICTNGSFSLPTTSTNNVPGTWSPAPNYVSTTTYTFQPNAGVCANTASMTITVNPYPIVSVQNDTICIGQSTTINSNVNLAGGSYAWLPTNSVTSSITVTPLSTAYFQVIYTLNGCADTSTTEIYVKPVSFPVINNQTICTGQTAELIATASLSGGTFIWSNSVQNDTLQVNPTTTTNYSVIYNLNGCVSPAVNAVVTVNPVPTVGVNNSTICAGNSTTITAIPNLLGGTFYWGSPGVVGASSQTLTPLNDTTLSVYYVLNGCSSAVATSAITVNPLPIATFSASVTQGCSPLSVTLTADDASNNTYNWSTSNALTAAGAQTSLLFQMNGGFDVTLTTTLNGCSVTETIYNYIQVDNYPIAAFEPSSDQFTEPNQTLSFMNNSLGAATYSWDFGDGGTSTEEGPIHTFGGNELGSTIILTAISTLGCTDTSQFFIGYDPGLVYYIPNSFTPDGDMNNQVFNPVFTSGIDIYQYTMYIYNRWGEIIFETNDPSIGWDGSFGMEGRDAELGVYTYQVFIKIPNFDERKMITGHVNLIR
jgi:gliding motility-associated-like protein